MIQIYADGKLAYDSRLEAYDLQGLKVTTALNKGGTAQIIMPPYHPAYSVYKQYRTVVEIYRDELLLFRGRALYPTDDYYNRRTVTCEGELCFFGDAPIRPYLYQDSPAAVFAAVVGDYNAQVEAFKQFKVGTVTVEDANDYIRLESSSAESALAVLTKLQERCGGYFVFTTDADGARVINWYKSLGYRSSQQIEFGSNLLDFTRSGSNTALATAVLPYGAKDEETGLRLTIESVNDGLDFIQDDEAVELRGLICKPVTWDDVTQPANLLRKAQEWLAANKLLITTLTLSALDLSVLDKSVDAFEVGDLVRVVSKPHAVDEDFLLTERTEDLLLPQNSSITLGKDLHTLTSADVAGDDANRNELHNITHQIISDYQLGIQNAVQELHTTLTSLIQQTSDKIMMEVSEQYTTNGQLEALISSTFTQLSDSFEFRFTELKEYVDSDDSDTKQRLETIESWVRIEGGKVILGEEGNSLVLEQRNDRISFLDNGAEVAYISNKRLYITDGQFLNSLQIGAFAWVPRENGNLSLIKVG